MVGCVVIDASDWLTSLDALRGWRQQLRDKCGLPVRQELKAADGFLRGRGAFDGLGLDRTARLALYGETLDFVAGDLPCQTFAVAIDKVAAAARGWTDPRVPAWTFTYQRLHTLSSTHGKQVMVFPDEGHSFLLRRLLRSVRRFHQIPGHFGGSLNVPLTRIVEDPNSRESHESYFVQVADLVAYSAHRSTYIDPKGAGTSPLWGRLAPVHLTAVNRVAGGPPAIVKYP